MSDCILAKLVVTVIVLISFAIWLALEKHRAAWLSKQLPDRYFG